MTPITTERTAITDARELLKRATGEELQVEPLLEYLEGKLLDAGLLTEPVRLPRS